MIIVSMTGLASVSEEVQKDMVDRVSAIFRQREIVDKKDSYDVQFDTVYAEAPMIHTTIMVRAPDTLTSEEERALSMRIFAEVEVFIVYHKLDRSAGAVACT